jgi:MoaD family protein
MRIRINYFGHFRQTFHKRSEEVQIAKNATLHDLLSFLSERSGELFKSYVFDPTNTGLKEDVLLNINGIPSHQLKGLKTQLSNGDQVNLMPLFSGGG